MGWRVFGESHGFGNEEEIGRAMERAYSDGCREGYEKAKREMEMRYSRYGERYNDDRMMMGEDYDNGYDDRDEFGERRGVRGTGRYSRYRR